MKKTYSITGKLIHAITSQPVEDLRIEAWDKDLIVNDFVGEAVSDSDGRFTISFTRERFVEFFLDNKPDLYFKIYKDDKLIHSTENDVLWNIENDVKDLIIKIPNMTDQPEEKEIPNIVSGKLTDSKNLPLAHLPVLVYNSDIAGDKLLAKTITGKEGNYGISWLQSQLGNSESKAADIAMQIVEREKKASVFTPVVNERRVNAGAKETIDIAVDAVEVDPGLVEIVFIIKPVSTVTDPVKAQITGMVRVENDGNFSGKNFQHLNVGIFQVTLSRQILLKTTALNENGMFNLDLEVEKNTTLMGRLYLRDAENNNKEILIAESGPHCPKAGLIFLDYKFDPSRFGKPLYTAVKSAVTPHLGNLKLTELDQKQLEQLQCIAGVDDKTLTRLIKANKLLADIQPVMIACIQKMGQAIKVKGADTEYLEKALPNIKLLANENTTEPILFALLKNDNSMQLHQVLTVSSAQLKQRIVLAVTEHIISPPGNEANLIAGFIALRNCMLFNSNNDTWYYDAKLIALAALDMQAKSELLDRSIEAGSLLGFLGNEDETADLTTATA